MPTALKCWTDDAERNVNGLKHSFRGHFSEDKRISRYNRTDNETVVLALSSLMAGGVYT